VRAKIGVDPRLRDHPAIADHHHPHGLEWLQLMDFDVRKVERELRARLDDWRGLLRRHTSVSRHTRVIYCGDNLDHLAKLPDASISSTSIRRSTRIRPADGRWRLRDRRGEERTQREGPEECRRRLAARHDLATGQVLRREIHVTRKISRTRGLVGVGCG
jgi:hypothetical protein